MCFHAACSRLEDELTPFYLPDGSISESDDNSVVIPEGVLNHVDNAFLNDGINSEDGVLGFVYEAGNEQIIVYTSPEAEYFCNNLEEESSEPDPFINSDISDLSEVEGTHEIDTDISKFYIEESQQKVIADDEFFTDDFIVEDNYYEYIELSDSDIESMKQLLYIFKTKFLCIRLTVLFRVLQSCC